MQTLELIALTPKQRSLERNAHPHLQAMRTTAQEIIAKCDQFRGSHDTREAIVRLSQDLSARTQALMAATDEDLISLEVNGQIEHRRMIFLKLLRKLQNALPHLASKEEGVSPLRKKIRAKLAIATRHLQKGELTYKDRESAALELGDVELTLEEIRTLDPGMDPWQPNLIVSDCTRLIDLLRAPLITPVTPPAEAKQIDTKRFDMIDLLYFAELAIRPLGRTAHGGRRQVEAILTSICGLHYELRNDPYSPVNVEQVRNRVIQIQSDLQLLNNVKSESGSGLVGFFVQEAEYARSCVNDVLKALRPEAALRLGGYSCAS